MIHKQSHKQYKIYASIFYRILISMYNIVFYFWRFFPKLTVITGNFKITYSCVIVFFIVLVTTINYYRHFGHFCLNICLYLTYIILKSNCYHYHYYYLLNNNTHVFKVFKIIIVAMYLEIIIMIYMVSLNRIKNYYNNIDIIYNTHVIWT